LLALKETASVIVAVPAGHQPSSVITATYDAGLTAPVVSNKVGSIGALSPVDGSNLEPNDVAPPKVDSLIKIGECANCSSDLYCDTVTANVITDEHPGACVMCGVPVSYVNSGVSMDIAIDTKTNEQTRSELANFFDFGELNTVDPNTLEENDMSNTQARRALLASVALAMRTIDEHTSDEAVITASDDDFAADEDSEDGDSLEVMDMDESDPSEDEDESEEDEDSEEDGDDEDDSSEEEAAEVITDAPAAESVDENKEGASDMSTPAETQTDNTAVDAPAADAPVDTNVTDVVVADAVDTPADAPAAEVIETPAAEAPAAEVAEEAPVAAETVTVEDAPAADAGVPAADNTVVASDDTVIEYVATTPAELSPDAEIVPVGETAYYVIQDNAPVAVLRKESASAGVQTLWGKPSEIRNTYRAAISGANRETALAQLGGSILRHSTKVATVIAERVATQETAAASEIAAERASFTDTFKQCLELAALGIAKGMFGKDFTNPVAAELAQVLETNGVRQPAAIVEASMILSMPTLLERMFKKASELADASDEVRTAQAELIGNAEFINAVPVVAAPAEPATTPTPETAAIAPPAKPRIDVAALTAGLGRQSRAFVPR
jgi:hypothetical protein